MHTTRSEEDAEEVALRALEEDVLGRLGAQIEAGEGAVFGAKAESPTCEAGVDAEPSVPVAAGSVTPSGSVRTTIRLPRYLLDQIRREASRRGLRYQALLKLVLQEAATAW